MKVMKRREWTLIIILLILSINTQAAECERSLQNFIRIIYEKGHLLEGTNLYNKKFNAADFDESCTVRYKMKNYILHLHPDDLTIIIESGVGSTNETKYQGPYFSAYKK